MLRTYNFFIQEIKLLIFDILLQFFSLKKRRKNRTEFYHAIYTSVIDAFERRCVIQIFIAQEYKRVEKSCK